MKNKSISILLAVGLVTLALAVLPATRVFAEAITWDGGAGTDRWSDAANWSSDRVPYIGDVVTLDNSSLAGSYTVVIDSSVSAAQTFDKLVIGYAGNANVITLNIASSSIVAPVISLVSAAADNIQLVIDQGGIISNQSGASGGRAIVFSSPSKIWQMNNDAIYVHNTANTGVPSSSARNVWQFSGTSTFEYKRPSPVNESIVAGVTYQNLKLSAGSTSASYSNGGTGTLTINGDFTVGSTVKFNPGLTGTTTFRANVTNLGTWNTSTSGPIVFDGTTTLGGTSVTTFNAGFSVNAGKSLTLAQNVQSAAATTVTVDGTLDANGNTLIVNGTLANNGTLVQTLPVTGSWAVGFFNTGSYGGVVLDAAGNGDLGSTVVTIRGNQPQCDGNSISVHRCFAIAPANASGVNATVTLYVSSAELGSQTCSSLRILHQTAGTWALAGTSRMPSCSAEPYSVQATGVTSFSPFTLASEMPTAVTLRALTARAPLSPLAAAPVAALVLVGGLAAFKRQRKASR